MKILHAGCGAEVLPPQYSAFDAVETRLDADPNVEPDIVATIENLGDIGTYGGIHCSHCLEHLHWDDAHQALREFYRVLDVGGFAYIQVPNLDGIKPTEDVVYEINGLTITGLDMIFGYRGYSRENHWYMHKSGWTAETLKKAMEAAGFERVKTTTVGFNLDIVGVKLIQGT